MFLNKIKKERKIYYYKKETEFMENFIRRNGIDYIPKDRINDLVNMNRFLKINKLKNKIK